MRTPIAPTSDRPYVVFYDGSCSFCRAARRMLERFAADVPMRFIDASDRGALGAWPRIDPARAERELLLLDPAGEITGGYDAMVALLAARLRRPAVSSILLKTPLGPLGRRAYRWIARDRSCRARSAALSPPARPTPRT